jgi:hypothetical protein
MASSSTSKGKGKSLRIETPSYPTIDGFDLPTDGSTDAGDQQDALDAAVADELVADTTEADSRLINMPHLPMNTCYRNAAVAALLNIAPFVNYIQQVATEDNADNGLAWSLASLAAVFRNVAGDVGAARNAKLLRRMSTFWTRLNQVPTSNNAGWTAKAWGAWVWAFHMLSANLG